LTEFNPSERWIDINGWWWVSIKSDNWLNIRFGICELGGKIEICKSRSFHLPTHLGD
jgi:hypothetical protein